MVIELRGKDLQQQAVKAIAIGWTDDIEVLQYLLANGSISGCWRKEPGGRKIEYSADEIGIALGRDIEMRPWTSD